MIMFYFSVPAPDTQVPSLRGGGHLCLSSVSGPCLRPLAPSSLFRGGLPSVVVRAGSPPSRPCAVRSPAHVRRQSCPKPGLDQYFMTDEGHPSRVSWRSVSRTVSTQTVLSEIRKTGERRLLIVVGFGKYLSLGVNSTYTWPGPNPVSQEMSGTRKNHHQSTTLSSRTHKPSALLDIGCLSEARDSAWVWGFIDKARVETCVISVVSTRISPDNLRSCLQIYGQPRQIRA